MRTHVLSLAAVLALAALSISDEAVAEGPAAAMADVKLAMAKDGAGSDRFHSNQQLELDIQGQGLCEVDIELHEKGRGRMLWTRRVRTQLPLRYVSDHGLPVVGRPGEARDYLLKIAPKPVSARGGGCRGRTMIHAITVVNRGVLQTRKPSTPLAIVPGRLRGLGGRPLGAPAGAPSGAPSSAPPAAPAGGAPEIPDNPPPEAGALTTLQVPGGSMTEGAGQQLQLDGNGTCAFDLRIQRTDGNGYDQTFPVASARPLPTTAVNGLEFPMLAAGSYAATATGKGGCSGAPTISFKVLPPPVVNKDPNAPSFKRPSNGQVRKPTDPDGTNVWFELDVPSALKSSDMSTGCCELQFDYKDATGAWQPLVESGPVAYPELKQYPTFRSISYFSQSLSWRVRARGYKWQTEFPWSEWVEFTVHQK